MLTALKKDTGRSGLSVPRKPTPPLGSPSRGEHASIHRQGEREARAFEKDEPPSQPKGESGDGLERRGPAPLEGVLAHVVEAAFAVVVPPGAVIRGLRHAVLESAAVGLVGAERVWRGAGPGAGLRAGRAVPGEEGHALAVLEEVEPLGAPVVHAQPHRPVVGSERRTQVAGERLHLRAVGRLCQAAAPRRAPRLRRRLRLEVAREQEALVADAQPFQAAWGWSGAGSGAPEAGRRRG